MRSAALWPLAALSLLLVLGGCSGAADDPTHKACKGLAGSRMRWVPGGTFIMGENPQYPEEGPPRLVAIPGFWMDEHELTNAEFAEFVKATGYRTMAERNPPVLPGSPPDMAKPGSAVFAAPTPQDQRWWRWSVDRKSTRLTPVTATSRMPSSA